MTDRTRHGHYDRCCALNGLFDQGPIQIDLTKETRDTVLTAVGMLSGGIALAGVLSLIGKLRK